MFRRGLWARHIIINAFGQLWAPKIKGFVAGVEDKGAVITKISSSVMIFSTTSITTAVSAQDSSTLCLFSPSRPFYKRALRKPVLRGAVGAAGDSASLPCA